MNTYKESKEKEIKERLRKMFPTDDDLIDGLMTMFGMSAAFTMYLSEFIDIFKHSMPDNIKYALAITAANMTALTHSDPDVVFTIQKYKLLEELDEQNEEVLIRRTQNIIRALYELLDEEETL